MKDIITYIFEQLILEYEREIEINDKFIAKIGNHGDERKRRGLDNNFKINLINITDKKIKNIINKFSNKILDKISNNTLKCGDINKTIQLIDYNITIAVSLFELKQSKYMLLVKSVWPTDDDYGNYNSKYQKNLKNKDNTKIFISDIK